MSCNDFFNEPKIQSRIKTRIVRKYFSAWKRVIFSTLLKSNETRIGFVDLFAGPGIYKDGTKSTPLEILSDAINDARLCNHFVTLFNDVNPDYIESLAHEINNIPNIDSLKYKPQLLNLAVGEDIIKEIRKLGNFPILFFIDPWGYKGLSVKLIESVIENWGCDCIFFFNYRRINAGLNNDKFQEHMESIFGVKNIENLRRKVECVSIEERERIIIEEMVSILSEKENRFTLPFCFKNDEGSRTNHYLFFISKNFKGYEIMKDIMAKESSEYSQEVASFSYCPADKNQPRLFEYSRPLEDLEKLLIDNFSGKEIIFEDLYRSHSIGRKFIKRNYKKVLLEMKESGKINFSRNNKPIRKNTLPDDVVVKFT